MALMEKNRSGRGERTRKTMRVYRRRRRVGLFVFSALLVILVGGLAFAALGMRGNGEAIGRAETPKAVEAPKPVSKEPARKAEEKAAKEHAARDAAAARKKAEEKRAAEGRAARERAAAQVPATNDLYLTVPRLGISGAYVTNSSDPAAMDRGAIKLPSTGFPWQKGANTYIAAHRIGYAGTDSYMQFYELPNMQPGDKVVLTDANGKDYTYAVSKVFAVYPSETWVTEPQPGRTMVSLQTCVESPDPSTWWNISDKLLTSGPTTGRLIVQADLVS